MEGDLGWCCRGGNNWDLHAVVRFGSGGGDGLVAPSPPSEDSFSWLPQPQDELINAAAWQPIPADPAVDDLCQAFLAAPKPEMPKPPSPRNAPLPQRSPADEPPPAKPRTSGRGGGGPTRSKRKSKKSLVTKEVTRVQAEAPSPDLWAWRKYGQKPIKGSPYPRGYYRCSTDKDCKARKQVERCRADPATLMVTYTGDHSHPVPLHRNSLAGTTRNKSQPPPSTSSAEEPPQPQALPSSASNSTKQPPQAGSPSASAGLSPATSLRSSSAEYEDAEEDDDTLAVRLLREDTAMAAGGDDDAFLFPKPDELGLGPVNGGGGCEDAMLFPNPDEPALGPVNGGGCEDAMLFPNSDEPAPGPGNGRGGCEDVMLFPKPDEPAPATTMISNRTDGGAGAAPVMDIVEDKFSVSGLPA